MRSLVDDQDKIMKIDRVTCTTIEQHSFFVRNISKKENEVMTKNKIMYIFQVLMQLDNLLGKKEEPAENEGDGDKN